VRIIEPRVGSSEAGGIGAFLRMPGACAHPNAAIADLISDPAAALNVFEVRRSRAPQDVAGVLGLDGQRRGRRREAACEPGNPQAGAAEAQAVARRDLVDTRVELFGIRDFHRKCDAALSGLADAITQCVERLAPRDPYGAFIRVVDVDARAAQAAVQLVLAQPSIGSQLVDNLNASSHVRAVLTDLFLLGEVLKI